MPPRTRLYACQALLGWLLWLTLAGPAGAVVEPRMLDWQARLSRMLPEGVRAGLVRVVEELPVTATLQDLRQAVQPVAPDLPPEPLELFAGIRQLLRQENTLQRFDERVALYGKSLELLRSYRQQVHEALRLAPEGPAGPPLPPPQEGLPRPEALPDGVRTLRLLPAPRPATPRARLRLCLQAAEQDEQVLRERFDLAARAREAFHDNAQAWRRYLNDLAGALDPATGHRLLPEEAGPPCACPLVEQIPPPPPLDLPELGVPPSPVR